MKTPQLPRITQPNNTTALTIKISAILFATIAIFHQDLASARKNVGEYVLLVEISPPKNASTLAR